MSIDTSKIKAGDTGTIKVTFHSPASDVVWVVFDRQSVMVPTSIIDSHTPAPIVVGVGDLITWGSHQMNFVVKGVSGPWVWLLHEGQTDAARPRVEVLADLVNLSIVRKAAS